MIRRSPTLRHALPIVFALALGSSFALLSSGCGGTVDSETHGSSTTSCPDCTSTCGGGGPDDPCACGKAEGGPCAKVGEGCHFGDDCQWEDWTCDSDHTWSVLYGDAICCPGFAPPCPSTPPSNGQDCTPCFSTPTCDWQIDSECGAQQVQGICGDDYIWHLEFSPACGCEQYATAEACAADPSCRYLEPCVTPAANGLPGCFPKVDCAADVPCPDGKQCYPMYTQDCAADGCAQCANHSICL